MENTMPEYPTVLVRMSPGLVEQLEKQGWDFGEPDEEGFYDPIIYLQQPIVHNSYNLVLADGTQGMRRGE